MARLIFAVLLLSASLYAQFGVDKWRVRGSGPSASRPAQCNANRDVYVCNGSGCSPDPRLDFCTAANTWTSLTGTNAVSSVFSRTGAVTAQSGDYTASQVTNAAATNAANSFGSGNKQTFNASAGTAGIRIACAALPSSPASGDVACDSGDSNKLKIYDGSTWVSGGGGSGTVTNTGTLTANLPVLGNGGADVTIGARSGNTTTYATTSGSLTSGNCAKFDANGNIVDNGGACGSVSGLGDPGSNSVPYRNGAGTTVPASATEITAPLYCADAGSNDTYACSLSPAPAAYANGAVYQFKANTANTGAATINFNSLGAKTIKKAAGGITTDLSDNDIRSGQVVTLTYDGTNMQMQSLLGNAGGGGSGNSTSTGAYASNPVTCADGDVRFPTDSIYLLRCASNAWVPWGPMYALTDPSNASLSTWRNQGSATVDTTYGGIFLSAPAASGDNLRIREKSIPSAPYTLIASFLPLQVGADYSYCGVVLLDSSGGKLVTLGLANSSAISSSNMIIRYSKWDSVTAFNNDYATITAGPGMVAGRGGITVKVVDDNTNRKASVCIDPSGKNCLQIHSVGRTDFMTPDKIGFFCNSSNATYPASAWLTSWKEE